MKFGQVATAKKLRSLSRLRGRVGVGVSPRVIVWREPPPASHHSMRCDLPRKRERCSEPSDGRHFYCTWGCFRVFVCGRLRRTAQPDLTLRIEMPRRPAEFAPRFLAAEALIERVAAG